MVLLQHLAAMINLSAYGMLIQDNKLNPRIKTIKKFLDNFLPFYFQKIFFQKKLTQMLQYFVYPKYQNFKHKMLQSQKEKLQVNQEQIYDHYQNLKDVSFQKILQEKSQSRIDYL
ncbi:unnamed protein product [Paramecium sonneborni]|uniref:Uncharacterized protein n=1 Tax=Paramecium sonneborni TaxID=65129 RepID=A0A8S1RP27_9CILI|nr:unnamed protein product [Paramecium sonneborni]